MNLAQVIDPVTEHADPDRVKAAQNEPRGRVSLADQLARGEATRRVHERSEAPRTTWTRQSHSQP